MAHWGPAILRIGHAQVQADDRVVTARDTGGRCVATAQLVEYCTDCIRAETPPCCKRRERQRTRGTCNRGGGLMKAAVLESARSFRVADQPDLEPGSGQVVIRLEGCGVCGSNL